MRAWRLIFSRPAGADGRSPAGQAQATALADPQGIVYYVRLFDGSGDYIESGGFAGTETLLSQRDWAKNVTTLSGDWNGKDTVGLANRSDNSYHVVFSNSADATAILDGFTIRSGYVRLGLPDDDKGGGISSTRQANPF